MNPDSAAAEAASSPATSSSAARDGISLRVATVNGTGSQTANTVLLRTLFRMGIPCSGKNIFPSNIAGLPTWFSIRTSRRGYQARRADVEFLVAMNPDTAARDVAEVSPGGSVVFDAPLGLEGSRDDVAFFPVPFGELVRACCPDARLRKLVVNMVSVGVTARLLGMDRPALDAAVEAAFEGKPKALDLNHGAVAAGWDHAAEHFPGGHAHRVEAMDGTAGRILIDGNAAAALGCLFAGVQFVSWYPITPSSSLAESLMDQLDRHRRDDEGRATFAVVQAEDEIAAIGMTLGAGWAGARAMTATSGPGVSLMAEFIGYGYYAEIPCVVFDIQRAGPSTGLPTRTTQGDLVHCALLSHGDTRHPLLLPSTVGECFEMAWRAFDLAERFQTPVFVLGDLDLGMNIWMSEPFPYPDAPMDRGKVMTQEDLLDASRTFRRYDDVDGDGIPWRTLPGTPGGRGAYFTRGSGHDEGARYTESGEAYVRVLDRIARKFETMRGALPAPVIRPGNPGRGDGKPLPGILATGTSRFAVEEALDRLREERDLHIDYARVLAFPFHAEVRAFLESHDRVYVVDQNRDGQLAALLAIEYPDLAPRLCGIRHYDGMPMPPAAVVDGLLAGEAAPAAAGKEARP